MVGSDVLDIVFVFAHFVDSFEEYVDDVDVDVDDVDDDDIEDEIVGFELNNDKKSFTCCCRLT